MAMKRDAAGVGSVRGLVLVWTLWLLGCWGVTWMMDSIGPAVRWMIFAALLGLMVVWPALRLSEGGGGERRASNGERRTENGEQGSQLTARDSQLPVRRSQLEARNSPLGQTLLDWVSLMVVFQAVIWPLRLSGGWSMSQTWWLNGAVASWSLLTGLVVAWGVRFDKGGMRALAMVGCVALVVGEPLVGGVMGIGGSTMWVSPLELVWRLTEPPSRYTAGAWGERVGGAALAAAVGWVLLAVWAGAVSRGRDVESA